MYLNIIDRVCERFGYTTKHAKKIRAFNYALVTKGDKEREALRLEQAANNAIRAERKAALNRRFYGHN